MEKLISVLGLGIMVLIAYLMSDNKKSVDWKLVGIGIGMQLVFGLLILKWKPGQMAFSVLNDLVTKLLDFTKEGTSFLFGNMLNVESFGFIFALQILPTIIFFSALMTVLYHLGIMEKVITVLAKIMAKLLGTSGAESLSAAANIFVGQTEAPLVIKPFIKTMTKSELLTIMTGGMATVAGGVMAGYVSMGVEAGHLIAASIMSAPASLIIAKIMVPETETPVTKGKVKVHLDEIDANIIDAAARGTTEGLKLALNVGAMLLSFIALVALLNSIIAWFGSLIGMDYLSLEWILGRLFAPLAYIMGIPLKDAIAAGNLLGQKIVINEFFAYANLSELIKNHEISKRTIVILTYALCGFANFSSIGIQVGGIGSLAPERRSDIAKLGFKALIGGSLAAFMTATIAGILI
ncbi:concentrative nucleoside transporter, CNT family [Caminicella sporogenes DSM 14501]|uniref:Nucleoside permease n=1 Tax=Caminicella sporogenes DSM 14501 TaxID=1121266 RepID=A0A1M6RZ07_9FIRM|nr:NupC/NupG family nucleoside CNT transporter [Caminicella sporogenes]RKD27143.1 Na+ dependent nucleoside transporter domain-containing protein [Caminicella sporogenes]WIF95548.1 NupC/NupG family nucleoside CNT transporter [Caminicella sporogenes]SHK37693.1 concentrative nucleoside transporter, CNT family [Caminicella sporogenes DSM 14501]